MGIFDFLKKIFKENKELEKDEKEKIEFSEIENWIEKKEKEIETREKEIFVSIKEKVKVLDIELKEKISDLEKIDINSKKEEEKAKAVTEEGKRKYIELVDSFMEKLNNLQEDKLERVIGNINKIFLEFTKSSHMSYERATVLIGKEMGNIKERIKSFSKELTNIFDENKDIPESSKLISIVKLRLKDLEETKRDINQINKVIADFEEKKTKKEEENKKISEEIEKIRKSPIYLEHLKKLGEIKSLEEKLEKDILSLRQLIDFKSLASFYHSFEKEMKILNSYRDNFLENFQKDEASILNLLNESKLNTNEISDKIEEINKKRDEITKNESEIGKNKDKTYELQSETAKITSEINNLRNSKSKEEKRHEKLNITKESLIKEITEEFAKLGMEIKP
ncbi:MAG: hypothetical protein Q7R52_01670 [archaeon]|nr:hypothetical protein [archaeon]